MIKDRNIAVDAAIQDTKIYGLTAKGDTFYVLKAASTALYSYTVARVPGGNLFTTVDAAINACTANHGDVIKILPGHTENVATASAITSDVAGVTIYGYGEGADKPTFTFNSADNSATWVVSAASVVIKNIIGTTSDDGLTNAFAVTGDDCELDIEWRDASATVEAASAIRLDTANNATVNLVYKGFTAGNAVTSAIVIDDCDNVDITIDAYGVNSTSWVDMVDVASTNVKVTGSMYTASITDFSQNVTDSITGSTWTAELFDGSAGTSCSGGSGSALAGDDIAAATAAIGVVDGYHDVPTKDATTDTVMRDVIGKKDDTAVGTVTTTKSLMGYVKGILEDTTVIGALGAGLTALSTQASLDTVDGYHDVPTKDATADVVMSDVIGKKDDTAAATGTTKSIVANVKYACDSLDTIDAFHDVPTKDATTDVVMSDVVGKKDDTAVGTVGTTKSLTAYAKGVLEDTAVIGTVVNAGGTATLGAALGDFANDTLIARLDDIGTNVNATTTDSIQGKIGTDTEMADRSMFDLLGGDGFDTAFPTANLPAADVSLAEVLREAYDQGEKSVSGSTAVMVNGDTIFTIAGGPIKIIDLVSICITDNNVTGSTLQYSANPTVGGAITFSGASASLTNFSAGGGVVLNQTALATAPDLSVVLVALGSVVTNNIIVNEGVITLTIGTGSTTGTWKHYLRYKPLGRGVTVVAT